IHDYGPPRGCTKRSRLMNPTDSPLTEVLNRTRSNLLDLSLRNRLLNVPRTTAKSKRLDIVDEKSDEVFRILVREERAMTFLAGQGEKDQASEAPTTAPVNGGGNPLDNDELLERYTDTRLQTKLVPE